MQLIKGKKGDLLGEKSIFWILIVGALSGIIFIYIFMLASYRGVVLHVPVNVQGELISFRFTNNPECFALIDQSTGRIYPGVIDFNKFNLPQLNGKCYPLERETAGKEFNFRLTLLTSGRILETTKFVEGVKGFTLKKGVLVYINGEFIKDELVIEGFEKIV